MTARDIRLADVRREIESLGCPYRISDEEIRAAIDAECAEWEEHSRRIRALLKTKVDEPREPIPNEWIIDRAARRVWDDFRLPYVFIRAEYVDEVNARRRGAA